MNNDAMTISADLIFADVVQDLSQKTGKSISALREAFVESPIYDALYNFDTGLWGQGPDYVAALFVKLEDISIKK